MADHGGSAPTNPNPGGASPLRARPTNSGSVPPNPAVFRSPKDVWKDRKARMDQAAELERSQKEQAQKGHAQKEAREIMASRGAQRESDKLQAIRLEEEEALRRNNQDRQSMDASRRQQQQPSSSTTTTKMPLVPESTSPSRKPTGAQEILARAGLTHDSATTTLEPAPTSTTAATATNAPTRAPRSSFPHAFERWETLSAHWEGLTNYWIRKLESNKDEIDRDPLSQQLSRQVTDLSAAGANLFHAVVELQRLRASSERKFTRWFFETRTELERCQEQVATLERALKEAQSGRVDAIHKQNDVESQANRHMAELRKELQISKDEARRAWEELGRREQEERDRIQSLHLGRPAVVGGVPVVPMMDDGAGRRPTAPRQGLPPQQPPQQPPQHPPPQSQPPQHYVGGDYNHHHHHQEYVSMPGTSAPMTTAPPMTSAPAHYRPSDAALHEAASYDDLSDDGAYSEDDYDGPTYPPAPVAPTAPAAAAYGQWHEEQSMQYHQPQHHQPQQQPQQHFQQHSQQQPQHSQQQQPQHPQQHSQQHFQDSPSRSPQPQSQSPTAAATPPLSWDAVPRHHHPTRLSDIMEVEEHKSRAGSTSHVGRQ